jgi:tetratricopeptide (TPR) repeat protein
MGLPESKIVNGVEPPAEAAGTRIFHAYGDRDDPIRLLVLLAAHAASLLGVDAKHCLDPTVAWWKKRDELDDLLDRVKSYDGTFAILVDLDALSPTPRDPLEDPSIHRMQVDMFDLLCRAIDRGGWIVMRPSPVGLVSERLSAIAAEESNDDGASIESAALAPDVRPIARWLMAKGRLGDDDLHRVLETESSPNDYILSSGIAALPSRAIQAARRISILRPPSRINGTFGPFAWGSGEGDFELDRASVDELFNSGFLQPTSIGSRNELRMARSVRSEMGRAPHEWAERAHLWLAKRDRDVTDPERILEAHHHAVRSGDMELAKATATLHGYELRALATARSRELDFEGAAKLFRYLVEAFEPTDAYSWEYLGYNLARWDMQDDIFGRHYEEIRAAYQRAHELDPNNPLYHGRWLGYQAECRRDITRELERGITKYLRDYDAHDDGLSLFAMPVLDGLRRGRRSDELDGLIAKWRPVLEKHAPKVWEKHARSFLDDVSTWAPEVSRPGGDWLLEVYSLVLEERREDATDLVFEKIDELLQGAEFDRCDEILRRLDVHRLSTSLMVAFLSITLAAKSELGARAALVDRIEARLREIEPSRLEGLLTGLR